MTGHRLFLAGLALWAAFVAQTAAGIPLISFEPAGVVSPEGVYALTMPSAAVRLPQDRWAILDGVNNRVVVTDDAGQGLEILGEGLLSTPLGMTLGPDERLWVADTGHRRILALSLASGEASREFAIPTQRSHPPDVVDLAFARDGHTLFAVDNDNDCILTLDTSTGDWAEPWGQSGTGLEELNHPFSIAVAPNDAFAIVDVINSRVLVRDPEYDFTFQVGDWGVDAGNLYRPKGVAFDVAGQAWVCDSVLGVVQVFAETGELIAVAADGRGVRHFRTPTRVTMDERGRLAVVEMRANRVSLWRIGERFTSTPSSVEYSVSPGAR